MTLIKSIYLNHLYDQNETQTAKNFIRLTFIYKSGESLL
jgi:hypothetical protein